MSLFAYMNVNEFPCKRILLKLAVVLLQTQNHLRLYSLEGKLSSMTESDVDIYS